MDPALLTSSIKSLKFVSQEWVSAHQGGEPSTINGYNVYTYDGTSYYVVREGVHFTDPLEGGISVYAFDSDNKIIGGAIGYTQP